MPTTKQDTGTVASEGLGASMEPMMATVANTTAALAPARADAPARIRALRRASLSPSASGVMVVSSEMTVGSGAHRERGSVQFDSKRTGCAMDNADGSQRKAGYSGCRLQA